EYRLRAAGAAPRSWALPGRTLFGGRGPACRPAVAHSVSCGPLYPAQSSSIGRPGNPLSARLTFALPGWGCIFRGKRAAISGKAWAAPGAGKGTTPHPPDWAAIVNPCGRPAVVRADIP